MQFNFLREPTVPRTPPYIMDIKECVRVSPSTAPPVQPDS